MAEDKTTLNIPPALYDYVLYYECANKDWKDIKKKSSISGNGGLMDAINWNSTYSYDPDDAGGKTLFGVTESAWKTYVKSHKDKGYNQDLNTMGRNGWLDQINWFWSENSAAGKCANYACAFLMFQMAWGGFGSSSQSKLLSTLKNNADVTDYNFITKGSTYKKIADATHAYKDPMVAYGYMRSSLLSYYYNISTPDKTNKKYRVGWLNRAALPFTHYGLYIPISVAGKSIGLKYESTLSDWDEKVTQMVKNNTSGYVKIFDWGSDPESINQIPYDTNDYIYNPNSYDYNNNSGSIYSGCLGVSQLGNFTNNSSTSKSSNSNAQNIKNRENILNTLIKGSYSSNNIKKCSELLSTDKKKGIKTKSEN